MKECETIEFKKSLSELKEGLVSIVAILNKHGSGELWFGVRNDGVSVGLDATTKTLRDVSQAISAHIEPRIFPHVTLESCARELENLILSRNSERLRWDNKVCAVSIGDLDKAGIRRFIARAGLVWDTPTNALEKLGLLHAGKLVNAAPLFFARKAPLQLRCAVFLTTESSTIIDRHDFDGNILELIEEAQRYILKNIHIGMRVKGLYREDVPEISVDALREAIINAFCHRDYRDPDYVHVAIFKDRVEIRNPGRLFGSLTLDDLRKGYVSQRRNPLIADLFRRIEMVEAWGRGMPLIIKNAPDVVFREIGNLFIVSFNRPSYADESGRGDASSSGKEVPVRGFLKESSGKKVSEEGSGKKVRERRFGKDSGKTGHQILDFLSQQPEMTVPELAGRLGLTTRAIEKQIAKLRDAKLLLRTGGRKIGRWEVQK
ncbi:MAG: putative DNA binding domain-containing protein [Lentisphaerae bacterium]|nr:putative DNA binding domain-containing protein [Lentisphaerota bacterium]